MTLRTILTVLKLTLRYFMICAFLVTSPPSHAQSSKKGQHDNGGSYRASDIGAQGVSILLKNVLVSLDQANKTGDYSVFRDLSAQDFRENNPAQLAAIFSKQRDDKMDLSGIVVLDPILTEAPRLDQNNRLYLSGFFPSVPLQLNYEMVFASEDKRWKLWSIYVNFTDSAPSAPDPLNDKRVEKPVPPPAIEPDSSISKTVRQ